MRAFILMTFALMLTACGIAPKHDPEAVFDDPAILEFTTKLVASFKSGNPEDVRALAHPGFGDLENVDETIAAVVSMLSKDPDLEISLFYSERRMGTDELEGVPVYATAHDVVGDDLTAQLSLYVALHEGKCCVMTHFNITMTEQRPSTLHDFASHNSGAVRYLFLAGMVIVPGFILFTLAACLRKPDLPRKWAWAIFIVCALWGVNLNWSTGEITNDLFQVTPNGGFRFNFISIQILGAGFSKTGIFAPWILELGSPVGAILYWLIPARRKAQVDTEAL